MAGIFRAAFSWDIKRPIHIRLVYPGPVTSIVVNNRLMLVSRSQTAIFWVGKNRVWYTDDTISVHPSLGWVIIGDNDGFLDLLHFQKQ